METRGIIVKIKGKSCIVLTPDGEYREVPLPKTAAPGIGREINLERKKTAAYLKSCMAAAALLVFILAGQLFLGQTPPAAAYLTIDINPSVELALTFNGRVVSARGLNIDGEKVLAQVKAEGRHLDEAVRLIVAQAVADRYLGEKDDNVILTTLTFDGEASPAIEMDSICAAIKIPLERSGVDSEIVIEPVEPEVRKEAAVTGISTGRYLVQQKSDQKGIPVKAGTIGNISLGNLEKENKVTIIELVDEGESDNDTREKGGVKAAKKRGIYIEREKDKNKSAGKTEKGASKSSQQNAGGGKRPH